MKSSAREELKVFDIVNRRFFPEQPGGERVTVVADDQYHTPTHQQSADILQHPFRVRTCSMF